MPQNKSSIVTVAKINCMAVRGKDNLSDENGEYVSSLRLLCGIVFTIKMSYNASIKLIDILIMLPP